MKLIQFHKKLGLPSAVAVSVGAVIGVGIFVIVGPIGAKCGSWMPLAFTLAAIPAVFGTLVAIALGSTIPADGGGYYYTKSLLGRYAGSAVSAMVVLGAMGAMGAVTMGVADYMRIYPTLLPDLIHRIGLHHVAEVVGTQDPALSRPVIAIGLILLSWGINAAGVMASAKIQIAMVTQLVSAIFIIVIAALMNGGNPDFTEPLPSGISPFLNGCVVAALAYTGFNIIGELGDEVNNPRRNIPLTILISMTVIMFAYIGVAWAVSGTLDATEMGVSDVALLATALHYMPDWTKHYINLAALMGAITSINAVFLAVPREFSAMAEDGILPKWIMRFNSKRQTFPVGIAIVTVAGCTMTLLDLPPDLWGLVCVAGLLGANVVFSIGCLRLFSLYPDKVASAPLNIRKGWLIPSAWLSALFSLGFVLLSFLYFWPVPLVMGVMVAGSLLFCRRADRAGMFS